MAATAPPVPKLDRYVVIHVATTCDEHGVYVTKDSAEVIELGWILLDSKTCDEVCGGWCWTGDGPGRFQGEENRLLTLLIPALSRECARQAREHSYHTAVQ